MENNGVLAVVVTYNGDENLKANLEALTEQVEKIIVVDNASYSDMEKYWKFCAENSIEVVKNTENVGIGAALNIAAKKGLSNYKYLLTMDQDSVLGNSAVKIMLEALENHPDLVSVGPNYQNYSVDSDIIYKDALITSGNLTLLSVYKEVGGFDESLFIDDVDFDFSLSIRKLSYQIAIVTGATMRHSIGSLTIKKFFFKTISIYEHSPLRYYYKYRNHKYFVAKYRRFFPCFCLKKSIMANLDIVSVILFHTNKLEKLKMIFKGKKDARPMIKALKEERKK